MIPTGNVPYQDRMDLARESDLSLAWFNMGTWCSLVNSCETAGCIGGTTVAMYPNEHTHTTKTSPNKPVTFSALVLSPQQACLKHTGLDLRHLETSRPFKPPTRWTWSLTE